jgi:hypothetical protein
VLTGDPNNGVRQVLRWAGLPAHASEEVERGASPPGDSGAASSSPPTDLSGLRRPRRTPVVLGMVSVAVAIGLVGGAYVLTDGFYLRHGGTATVTVIPQWTYDSLPGGQYDASAFVAHATSRISGSFTNSNGIVVYLMTPVQLELLDEKGVVDSYDWTSGSVHDLTLYNLTFAVTTGPWDIVLLNPDPINVTVVDFWTAVIESPA